MTYPPVKGSKAKQADVTATSTPNKLVPDRADPALQKWLEAAGITEAAMFRRMGKRCIRPALSPVLAGVIVQRGGRLAGPEGDFGGSSLRPGYVPKASRQGVTRPLIM